MRYPPYSIFLLLLLSPDAVLAEGPDEVTTQEAFEFAFMIFEDFRVTPEVGVVYEPALHEYLGIPDRTEKVEEYGDPTYKVIRETMYYEGLEIVISRAVDAPPSGWTWLERVRVSDRRHALRHGLRVGLPLEEFENVLGPWRGRRSTDAPDVSFYAGGYGEPGGVTHGAHATVALDIDDDGLVNAVEITYWAD